MADQLQHTNSACDEARLPAGFIAVYVLAFVAGAPFRQRNMHGKSSGYQSLRIRRRTEITTIRGMSFLLSVEGFMVVELFAAVANVRGSGGTWRRSRKLPCRTNADGRLSSCQ